MSYLSETEPSWRADKRRRTAITLLVVLALLAAAIYYFASYWKDDPSASPKVCPSVTASPGAILPSAITVNVYNATKRNGLAGKTGTTLKGLGFKVGSVANDPLNKAVKVPAEIRYGAKGAAAAKLVATYVPKSVLVLDKRTTTTVDLVLGEAFSAVVPPKTATPGSASTTC